MKFMRTKFAVLSFICIPGSNYVEKLLTRATRKAGQPNTQGTAISAYMLPSLPILLACTLGLLLANPAHAAIVADSFDDWSLTGTQGENGWYNGYYNQSLDANGTYETADFIPFLNDGSGTVSPTNHWNSWENRWQLTDNPQATTGPWTSIGQLFTHPNGINSNPQEEHWTIRRWVSDVDGPVNINWYMSKLNPNGTGVSGLLFVNGLLVDSASIDGNDTIGFNRSILVSIGMSDIIELALSPVGPSGDRTDGADGSLNRLTINAVPVPAAVWLFGSGLFGLIAIARRKKLN